MRIRLGENFVTDTTVADLNEIEENIGKTVLNASFKNMGIKLLRKLSL